MPSGKPGSLSQDQPWGPSDVCAVCWEAGDNEHACGNALNRTEKFYANLRRNGRFSTGDYEIDVVTSAALMFSPKNFILCLLYSHKGHTIPTNREGRCICTITSRLRERKPCSSNLTIPIFSSFLSCLFCGFSYFIPLTEIISATFF